jgi:small-conductance mechanosensitive channel
VLGLLASAVQSKDPGLDNVVGKGLTAVDWLRAGIIIVAAVMLAKLIEVLTRRIMAREDADHSIAQFAGRLARNVVILAGFVYALITLDVRIGPLLGAIGLGGLAIAFAAQTIIENVFASVLLRTRRPFRRGDQITSNGYDGVIHDVNFRTVVIRTFEGERVYIPCSEVLNNPIVNHTSHGRRRTTLEVGVGYDTDLAEAQQVIVDAVKRAEGVNAHPAPEAWVESFGDSAVNFAVRFWHQPEQATMFRVRSAVAMAIKRALDDHEIDIPFPQRVLTVNAPIDIRDGQRRGPASRVASGGG